VRAAGVKKQSTTLPLDIPNNVLALTFVCGGDDYLVNKKAKLAFEEQGTEWTDLGSQEIIRRVVKAFLGAIETLPMFGSKKAVWLKGMNFLSDTVMGKAQGTKVCVETMIKALNKLDSQEVRVVISASPIDRRTKHFKALQKLSKYVFIESGDNARETLLMVAHEELREGGGTIDEDALVVLIEKIKGNARLLSQEIKKLQTYLGDQGKITQTLVHDLVPQFGQGDFFEPVEAFFAKDIPWALKALDNYFFHHKEGRPLLSAFQNRGRILIQLKALIDGRNLKIGFHGVAKHDLAKAANDYQMPMTEKSSYNVFSQNPWYLGKLAAALKHFSLETLMALQREFLEIFEDFLDPAKDQQRSFKSLVLKYI